MARLLAWLSWAMLALLGLVFMLALLGWLLIMAAINLVSGWVTGRPSTVSQLWQAWRQTARQRWTHARGTRPGPSASPPETPPPTATRRSADTEVQDVSWRELPPRPPKNHRPGA